jgi:hypothetical protein
VKRDAKIRCLETSTESTSRLEHDPRGRHDGAHPGRRRSEFLMMQCFDVHFTGVAAYNGAYVI